MSTDGALSLFLLHRWTQSHLFHSPMPYSCIISMSVFTCLTCLLSDKNGCLLFNVLSTGPALTHALDWECGCRYHAEMPTFHQSCQSMKAKMKITVSVCEGIMKIRHKMGVLAGKGNFISFHICTFSDS